MKKVLITGSNGYIGNSFKSWINENYSKEFEVDSISVRNFEESMYDFSQYDVIYHVAAIVHLNEKKISSQLYYDVNSDLTYEIAKKAKKEGVKHFVFLSTMSVYGLEKGIINNKTTLNPKTHYGISKLNAEISINNLCDDIFKVSIIRAPMVYGYGCKGNYQRLSKISKKIFMFPNYDNNRSMIFIDNLSEFVKQIISNNKSGFFFPQNNEYVNTSEMVELIRRFSGKKTYKFRFLNPLIKKLNSRNISIVNKLFGSLVYDFSMSKESFDYVVCNFEESIYKSVLKSNCVKEVGNDENRIY